jgi:Sulfotransferase family
MQPQVWELTIMTSVWPNLFVVGAAKSGTTSLAYYLGQHPDIFMSKLKEPHYFSGVRPVGVFAHTVPMVTRESDYLRLFGSAMRYHYRGEASTSYLWSPQTAERIADQCPEARILAVLREPLERLYSHYLNEIREGIETRPIDQAVREDCALGEGQWGVHHLYVEYGLYGRQLARYLDVFPREQIMVIFQEDLRERTREVMCRLFVFLGLDPQPARQLDITHKNTYRAPPGSMLAGIRRAPWARAAYRTLVPRGVRMMLREQVMFNKADKPAIPHDSLAFLRSVYGEDLRRFPRGFEPLPAWLAEHRGMLTHSELAWAESPSEGAQ